MKKKSSSLLNERRGTDWVENDLHNSSRVGGNWFANHVALSQFTEATAKKSNAGTKGTQMGNHCKVKFHTLQFTSQWDPNVQSFWSYMNLITLFCTTFKEHSTAQHSIAQHSTAQHITGCLYTYTAKQLILILHIHLGVLNVGQVFSRHWNSDPTSRNPFRNFNLKCQKQRYFENLLLTVQTNI